MKELWSILESRPPSAPRDELAFGAAKRRMRAVDKLVAKALAARRLPNEAGVDQWNSDIEQIEKLLLPLGHEWLAFYAASKALEIGMLKKIGLEFAAGARAQIDAQAQQNAKSQIEFAEAVLPTIGFAAKFQGQGGGESRLKKAIRAHLKTNRDAKPRDIWNAFLAKPPRGLKVLENAQGRYIESLTGSGGIRNTNYERFQNAVAEVRKTLPKATGYRPVGRKR